MSGRLRRSRRGQSVTLSYTYGLAISLVLITGLLVAGGNFVQDQRERALRSELQVIGQQISADMATLDRLVQSTGGESTISFQRSMPETVAGSSYTVELVEREQPELVLTSRDPEIEVTVRIANETAVTGTRINGGEIRFNETGTGTLTLETAGDDR